MEREVDPAIDVDLCAVVIDLKEREVDLGYVNVTFTEQTANTVLDVGFADVDIFPWIGFLERELSEDLARTFGFHTHSLYTGVRGYIGSQYVAFSP